MERENIIPNEIKNIPGWEGLYAITPSGKLFSYPKKYSHMGKWISPGLNNKGYYYAGLRINNKSHNLLIHRLIALTFIPNPENKPCINHIDCNPKNNDFRNLEWCTYSENQLHARKMGRTINNISVGNKSISHPQNKAVQCMDTGVIYYSMREATDKTGINISNISQVCKGKRKTAGKFRWCLIKDNE